MPANLKPAVGPLLTAALYFAGAVFSVHFSRFSGGVAMIWVSSAILAARLLQIPTRDWPVTALVSGVASALATGWFGLGWACAGPLAVVNVAEAVAAALVGRSYKVSSGRHDVVDMIAGYYFGLGLIVPAVSALLGVGIVTFINEIPFEPNFYRWMIGHAVGLLTILPFAAVVSKSLYLKVPFVPSGRGVTGTLLVGTMAVLTVAVFTQPIRPLMLAPLLLSMLAAVWADLLVAMALPVILALIGGFLTLHGFGPMGSITFAVGDRVQLFQLYVAIIMLCALPVIIEQERRRQEMKKLVMSEAHWRQLSSQRLAPDLVNAAATAIDALTGCLNRHALVERVAHLISTGRHACVADIRIDSLAHISRQHGLAVANELLRAFSVLAPEVLRGPDMIARVADQDFALLLPNATPDQAEAICVRLNDKLADTIIQTCAGPAPMVISWGVAPLQDSAERTLRMAAQARKNRPAQEGAIAAVA